MASLDMVTGEPIAASVEEEAFEEADRAEELELCDRRSIVAMFLVLFASFKHRAI